MNRINNLFKRVQCWVQSGIFGYCGNGTGNRVHPPLYRGCVKSKNQVFFDILY